MVSQITHCYSYNRQSLHPVKLYCTSFGSQTKAEFDDKKPEYERWRKSEVLFLFKNLFIIYVHFIILHYIILYIYIFNIYIDFIYFKIKK